MPIVRIDLIRRVTAAVVAALDVRPKQVRVLLAEVPPEHWTIGGEAIVERAGRGDLLGRYCWA